MIDTIRFKIPLTQEEYLAVQNKGTEVVTYDKTLGAEIKKFQKGNINIPSYDYNLNYWCYDELSFFLEFSVPKFFYGHNIFLLYPSQLEQALIGVHHRLQEHFGVFPHYENWLLQRLDLCYAWKYQDASMAAKLLSVLKTLDYPKKIKTPRGTSVDWVADKYSLKFYLKQPEFKRHDYDTYAKKDIDVANEFLNLSSGVLRFEVTLRKFMIDFLFKRKKVTYKDLLNKNFLTNTLNLFLNTLLSNFNREAMTDVDVAKHLIKMYGKKLGMRRYAVYELYFSPTASKRHVYNEIYSKDTIRRYKKDLAAANVSILPISDFDFDLHIPSEFVVNKDPADRASEPPLLDL